MAENLIWCVGAISGCEVFAGSTVKAPETPCASAAGETPENIPASPAACRKSRRFDSAIVTPVYGGDMLSGVNATFKRRRSGGVREV